MLQITKDVTVLAYKTVRLGVQLMNNFFVGGLHVAGINDVMDAALLKWIMIPRKLRMKLVKICDEQNTTED